MCSSVIWVLRCHKIEGKPKLSDGSVISEKRGKWVCQCESSMGKPGLKLSVDVEAAREDEHESGEAESRESSPRVAKALFQSGSEGESDKENDTKLVETVRHRQRRNERRHEFLASPMGRRRSRDHRHSPLPSGRPSPASRLDFVELNGAIG